MDTPNKETLDTRKITMARKDMSQFSGWVTTAGEWLPLSGTHLETAAAYGEMDPDDAGWVHVVMGTIAPVVSVTVEQHATLVRLAKDCKADLFWLKDCEVR